jgi:hypothetical protein
VKVTVSPGFSGTVSGDFSVRGEHLHFPYWHDAGSQTLTNGDNALHWRGMPGFGPSDETSIMRFYAWGDDSVSGSYVIWNRSVSFTDSAWGAFGFTEDETTPSLPAIYRMFTFGQNSYLSFPFPHWGVGPVSDTSKQSLVAFGFQRRPVWGATSCYSYLSQADSSSDPSINSPRRFSSAGDCPFIDATELLPVEVLAGVMTNMYDATNTIPDTAYLEPRRIGVFPIARLGRANFGNYVTSTDTGKTWIHMEDGIYLPWSGSILP